MASTQSLWKNIASLGALQVFNFALTLSTLPYLARTLGVTGWGGVVFVQMVLNYLSWVANWGFYLGATKRIAAERADKQALSHIFMATWVAQWWLTALLMLMLAIGIGTVPMLRDNQGLYFAGAGLLIGNALTPLWYLNGLEKIRESAIIQMAVKLLALPNIFIFVSDSSDAATYLAINSACSIIVGVLTMWWIYKSKAIDFDFPLIHDVRSAIVNEYRLFVSALWANLNATLIPAALGIWGGAAELGYYNLADRARSAAITILHPITHALFPRMCYLFSNEKARAMQLLKYSGASMLVLSCGMSGGLLLFSNEILAVLGGKEFQQGSVALKWLAFSPVCTTISAFIIHQILIPSNESRGYLRAMFCTLILSAILIIPAVSGYGAQGAAAASIGAELFTVLFLSFYVWSQKLLRFEKKLNESKHSPGDIKA